jgi:hypothetical protein
LFIESAAEIGDGKCSTDLKRDAMLGWRRFVPRVRSLPADKANAAVASGLVEVLRSAEYLDLARSGLQGHVVDDLIDTTYEAVTCIACGRVRLVNPKSGKVLEPAKK